MKYAIAAGFASALEVISYKLSVLACAGTTAIPHGIFNVLVG